MNMMCTSIENSLCVKIDDSTVDPTGWRQRREIDNEIKIVWVVYFYMIIYMSIHTYKQR